MQQSCTATHVPARPITQHRGAGSTSVWGWQEEQQTASTPRGAHRCLCSSLCRPPPATTPQSSTPRACLWGERGCKSKDLKHLSGRGWGLLLDFKDSDSRLGLPAPSVPSPNFLPQSWQGWAKALEATRDCLGQGGICQKKLRI